MLFTGNPVARGAAFTDAARRYWTGVFPQVCRELSHWRRRAGEIPDPVLRQLALDAQRKRGNLEGAAAFATFAPRSRRPATVRALVAFQSAYNYLDLLAEQPHADPIAGGRRLHEALLVALDSSSILDPGGALDPSGAANPSAPHLDYYAHYPQHEDNGYLAELVDICRAALATLPSYPKVTAVTRRAAERIAEFQSLNLSTPQGAHDAFAQWAHTQVPAGTELEWWEAAAAGGSSLCVYALIAAAAEPIIQPGEPEQIEDAYFPWIGALHSLLDHLVDKAEDATTGQRNLIDYYASPLQAATRMQALAVQATGAARGLPRGHQHEIILAGMAGYYLSFPEASAPNAAPIAKHVRTAIGQLATPALLVFKARRLVAGSRRPRD
jgi:tetraprenyl-beta-curcumene synthase